MPQSSSAIQSILQRALAAHQRGQLAEAESLYRAALNDAPDHFDALNLMGVLLAQRGESASAAELIGRAVAINPNDPSANANLGKVLLHLGRHAEALACYDRILAGNPGSVDSLCNRGNALAALGRRDEALASYDRAAALQPGSAGVHFNRGNLLIELKRYGEALAGYERALALAPDSVDVLVNRGNTLRQLRRLDDALASYDRALAKAGDRADVLVNRGNTLREMQRLDEALASYDRALAVKPTECAALNSRGNVLRDLQRYDEAIASYERALAIEPGHAELLRNLRYAKMQCCDWGKVGALEAAMVADVEAGTSVENPFSFLWLSSDPRLQQLCARSFVRSKFEPLPRPLWTGERYRHDKIRIAYLSADFHSHATAFLMAGLFEEHDRTRFDFTALSYGPPSQDETRRRLTAAFPRFLDVRGASDADVARTLRDLEIDIAVDLKGHTKENRLGILSHRPAPVQVTYLGHPGTLGAPFIDYVLADRVVIPAEHQAYFDEHVVYLPDTYQVNDSKRPVAEQAATRAELGLPEQAFVFCCFNNNYKITPEFFDVWMRLLRQVDGSVLWLLEDNAYAARNLRREAEARGVAAERLVFAARMELDAHLARHRHADLFLDTLPYNAHTTASDALWAGLPVVTCIGKTFSGRVAASLLHAVGLPELVTQSLADYESLALKLATDRPALGAVKAKLFRNRATAPLFDTKRFARHIEAAYTGMWERHQRGEEPARFSVPAL